MPLHSRSPPPRLLPPSMRPPLLPAVSVGVIFSAIIVVLQFCHAWQAATVVAAILCFFAGLEAFLNFCAGAWARSYPGGPAGSLCGWVGGFGWDSRLGFAGFRLLPGQPST